MRPLTIGILVGPGPDSSFARNTGSTLRPRPQLPRAPSNEPADPEARLDMQSGSDLLQSVVRLGHIGQLLRAETGFEGDLAASRVDACLLATHGRLGGSGHLQGVLGLKGIPHAGAPASAVAVAFDKIRARQLLAFHNLPVPTSLALAAQRNLGARALDLLGWPCVLKPRRGAHGLGVTRLTQRSEVADAVARALDLDQELVLERAVDGPEIQVVMLGERVLGAMQIDRELDGSSEMRCPPRMSRAKLDGIYNLARRAVLALGLEGGLSRVDVIVSPRHNEMVLEVEPMPPLHREGTVARVAKAAGFDHERLVAELLRDAVADAQASMETSAHLALQ